MTDDRAPSLSHLHHEAQLTGREPVLKGVGSRLLADRRGAYLAGNLEALIAGMDDAQRREYHRWCVKVCIRKARNALPVFRASYPDDARAAIAINAAIAWLAEPNELTRARARRAGISAGYAGLNHTSGDALKQMQVRRAALAAKFTALAAYVPEPGLHVQVVSVAARFAEVGPFVTTSASDAAKRAQLRAACTILTQPTH